MAEYTPTIWECGDVVTAERLNHMEEGIEAANACCEGGGGGNEPFIVGVIDNDYTCPNASNSKGETKGDAKAAFPTLPGNYKFNFTFQDLVDALAEHRTFLVDPSLSLVPAYMPVLFFRLAEPSQSTTGVYEAMALVYIFNGSDYVMVEIHAYCDVIDDNMVSVDCWGAED